jgi:hypothetical protein
MAEDYDDVLIPRGGLDEDDRNVLDLLDDRMAFDPVFNEALWPLSAVARWVQRRTEQAANGWTIEEEELPSTLDEMHAALQSGNVVAYGIFGSEPTMRMIPRRLGRATCSASRSEIG